MRRRFEHVLDLNRRKATAACPTSPLQMRGRNLSCSSQPLRTPTGKPTASAAPALYRIRARADGREGVSMIEAASDLG